MLCGSDTNTELDLTFFAKGKFEAGAASCRLLISMWVLKTTLSILYFNEGQPFWQVYCRLTLHPLQALFQSPSPFWSTALLCTPCPICCCAACLLLDLLHGTHKDYPHHLYLCHKPANPALLILVTWILIGDGRHQDIVQLLPAWTAFSQAWFLFGECMLPVLLSTAGCDFSSLSLHLALMAVKGRIKKHSALAYLCSHSSHWLQ